jgi:hypothetical protein
MCIGLFSNNGLMAYDSLQIHRQESAVEWLPWGRAVVVRFHPCRDDDYRHGDGYLASHRRAFFSKYGDQQSGKDFWLQFVFLLVVVKKRGDQAQYQRDSVRKLKWNKLYRKLVSRLDHIRRLSLHCWHCCATHGYPEWEFQLERVTHRHLLRFTKRISFMHQHRQLCSIQY